MKTISRFYFSMCFVLLVAFPSSTIGQSNFRNLGFESATLVPIPGDPYGRVQFTPALPGWTGSLGGIQQDLALYNNTYLSTAGIAIIGNGWPYGGRIQGNFTAVLQPGLVLPGFNEVDASLAQTAIVPFTTKSLLFNALAHADPLGIPQGGNTAGTFEVSMGGQVLPLFVMGSGPNYTMYGADIENWSAQPAELKFTALAGQGGHNNLFLDSIQFSAVAVPEPSVLALMSMGALLLAFRRWRNPPLT